MRDSAQLEKGRLAAVHRYRIRGYSQLKGFRELLRHETKIEALFVWVTFDAAKALRESLSIAMLAAGADFRATLAAGGSMSRRFTIDL